MHSWLILITGVCIFAAASLLYLITRATKFETIRKKTNGRKWKMLLAGTICVFAASAVLTVTVGVVNLILCIFHLIVVWALADLACAIICRIRKKKFERYYAGLAAIMISVLWLSYGWYVAHHVVCTSYQIDTAKELAGRPLRIVMFSDSHIGVTFHAPEFEAYLKQMEALSPDVLVIVGDYVDDDTSKEDMMACCKALGDIKIPDGIYYVFGNHDRGYFPPENRGYDGTALAAELEKNGVMILQDESVLIDDRYYLIGREDAGISSRMSMDELLGNLDQDKYMVVLDHEPHDYEAQEKSGVDLVLSGHTHGGWLFPFNRLSEITGTDDKVYGRERRSGTDFIVSSGISEWAFKFRTGCVAEYVVIEIVDQTA